ncbi:succinate dehydrogenase, hydrophobic membrane anchor protein [Marinimicrococcus flavescens]|uniref:Succinate dehydrogenase hydrophobic membrane anchor subunit n=1 Tax=Marinimicrococcus flavescens TaxID=3031815 RepID=A0AAP3XPG0_9PROT|nr:succinate dehydrogenase, hydrophobic membrane anchor protein [Marinimicrococcus flavescens]
MATRSAIGRVKARGSAREGVGHWKMQRLTSIGLVLLVIWFVLSAVSLSGASYLDVRAWLAGPFNATMMVLLVVAAFWHAKLGIQVIIEDYVHHEGVRIGSLVALKLAVVALAAACLVAIVKVSLGS